jgi:hypothetical protein
MVYKIQRLIIALFIVIAVVVGYFIVKMACNSKVDWINNKQCNTTVIHIYNGYKGKPNYQVMLLADSQRFTIPKLVLPLLQVGDSVVKVKDSSFYTFILLKTKQEIKAGWN